jgi:hypothetical protein
VPSYVAVFLAFSHCSLSRKVLTISEYIIHPRYKALTAHCGGYSNDIALLKLTESVDLTTYTPACLPAQGTDYTGQKSWVYGQHPTPLPRKVILLRSLPGPSAI